MCIYISYFVSSFLFWLILVIWDPNVDIDGQEGMKLTFGTIVVEGKDSQGKVAKVINESLTHLLGFLPM